QDGSQERDEQERQRFAEPYMPARQALVAEEAFDAGGLLLGEDAPAGDAAEKERADRPGQERHRSAGEIGDRDRSGGEQRQRSLPPRPQLPEGDLEPRRRNEQPPRRRMRRRPRRGAGPKSPQIG